MRQLIISVFCLITHSTTLEEINIKDNIRKGGTSPNMKTQRSCVLCPKQNVKTKMTQFLLHER